MLKPHLYPFDSHYLDIDGLRLHYLDEGPRDAPVVLMLHGNPSWSFLYRDLIQDLRATHRVIAPDHIGCGLSDKPQDFPYQMKSHVENVRRLIDHLGVDRYSLCVHDWGGPIGFGVATAQPERLERLVIFNTTCDVDAKYPLRIRICWLPLIGPILVQGLAYFSRGAAMMAVTKPLPKDVTEGFVHPYDSWAHRVANLRFIQDIPRRPDHPTHAYGAGVMAQLPALHGKPTMICWGMKDPCFTPSFLRTFRATFPDATVHEYHDAGHYVIEDANAEIRPLVRSFFGLPSQG